LKKENRCKQKGFVIYSTNNKKKSPKSRESYAHSGTGNLQDTKQTDQNRTTPQHVIIKKTSTENRERILKAVIEKKQITYKGTPIKIIADFSMEALKARRAWSEVFRALNENNFNPKLL
jgi:hypothetical protein